MMIACWAPSVVAQTPCASVPCQNGGTCTNSGQTFSCSCVAGFSGTLCQTNINDCASNPCVNGNTCVDGTNSYLCQCNGGNACINGGICLSTAVASSLGPSGYCYCNTTGGFGGPTCSYAGLGDAFCGSSATTVSATSFTATIATPTLAGAKMTSGNAKTFGSFTMGGWFRINAQPTGTLALFASWLTTSLSLGIYQNNYTVLDNNQNVCVGPSAIGDYPNSTLTSPNKWVHLAVTQIFNSAANQVNKTFYYNGNPMPLQLASGFTGSCTAGTPITSTSVQVGFVMGISSTIAFTFWTNTVWTQQQLLQAIGGAYPPQPPLQWDFTFLSPGTIVSTTAEISANAGSDGTAQSRLFNNPLAGVTAVSWQSNCVCSSNPCQNGATCFDVNNPATQGGINTFVCTCAAGYSGTTCQTVIDTCASQPCLNGATCTATVNLYTCNCSLGWYGQQCQLYDQCIANRLQYNNLSFAYVESSTTITPVPFSTFPTPSSPVTFSNGVENIVRGVLTSYDQQWMLMIGSSGAPIVLATTSPLTQVGTLSITASGANGIANIPRPVGGVQMAYVYAEQTSTVYNLLIVNYSIPFVSSLQIMTLPVGRMATSPMDTTVPYLYFWQTAPNQVFVSVYGISIPTAPVLLNTIAIDAFGPILWLMEIQGQTWVGNSSYVFVYDPLTTTSVPLFTFPCNSSQANPAFNATTQMVYILSTPVGSYLICQIQLTTMTMTIVPTIATASFGPILNPLNVSEALLQTTGAVTKVSPATWNLISSSLTTSSFLMPITSVPGSTVVSAPTCQNGGSCTRTSTSGGYTCTCALGYTGYQCGFFVDTCASAPCQNGATCTSSLGVSFTCNCVTGFSGTLCQTEIDTCASIPCLNGGTCTPLLNMYYCNCSIGWYGTNCQLIDPCISTRIRYGNESFAYLLNGNAPTLTPIPFATFPTISSPVTIPSTAIQTFVVSYDQQWMIMGAPTQLSLATTFPLAIVSTISVTGSGGTAATLLNIPRAFGPTQLAYAMVVQSSLTNVLIVNYSNPFGGVLIPFTFANTVTLFATSPVDTTAPYLYAAVSTASPPQVISVYTITNPYLPVLVNTVKMFGQIRWIAEVQGQLWTANSTAIYVFDPLTTTSIPIASIPCNSSLPGQGPAVNTTLNVAYVVSDASVTHPLICEISLSTLALTIVPGPNTGHNFANGPLLNPLNGSQAILSQVQTGSLFVDQVNPPLWQAIASSFTTTTAFQLVPSTTSVFGSSINATLNTCQNGGSCSRTGTSTFACTCALGYTGYECSQFIDTCASLPCQNGGTCTSSLGISFTCTCVAGYSGSLCQTLIDTCTSQPCQNGGVCTDLVNGFNCTCTVGFEGTFCQYNDPCQTANPHYASNPTAYLAETVSIQTFNLEPTSAPTIGSSLTIPGISSIVTGILTYDSATLLLVCSIGASFEVVYVNTSSLQIIGTVPISTLAQFGPANVPNTNLTYLFDGVNAILVSNTKPFVVVTTFALSATRSPATSPPIASPSATYLYVIRSGVLHVYTIANPASPVQVNTFVVAGGNYLAELLGNIWVMGAAGIQVYAPLGGGTPLNTFAFVPIALGAAIAPITYNLTAGVAWFAGGQTTSALFEVNLQTMIGQLQSAYAFPSWLALNPIDSTQLALSNGTVFYTMPTSNLFDATLADTIGNTQFLLAGVPSLASTFTPTCQNGGTCTQGAPGSSTYLCTCTPGWSGVNCQTLINVCASAPCQNGATCTSFAGLSYTCTCAAGYSGVQCQTQINMCASNPCVNGATCNALVNAFNCTCVVGFMGPTCNVTNPCFSLSPNFEGNLTAIITTSQSPNDLVIATIEPFGGIPANDQVLTVPSSVLLVTSIATPDQTHWITATSNPSNFLTIYNVATLSVVGTLLLTVVPTAMANAPNANITYVFGSSILTYVTNTAPFEVLTTQVFPTQFYPTTSPIGSSNTYLYRTDGTRLYVYSIANPFAPTLVNTITLHGTTASPTIPIEVNGLVWVNRQASIDSYQPLGSSFVNTFFGGVGPLVRAGSTSLIYGPQGSIVLVIDTVALTSAFVTIGGGTIPSQLNLLAVNPSVPTQVIGADTTSSGILAFDLRQPSIILYSNQQFRLGGAVYPLLMIDPSNGTLAIPTCQNNATCTAWNSTFATCNCTAGYTGAQCQSLINICASQPCQNGATCTSFAGLTFTCTCAAGYSGVLCQTQINVCASSPCINGGTCNALVNHYTCTCPTGYSGVQCQTQIDTCASQPCQHGGTCTDQVGSYTCACAAGYSGAQCQTDINECASQPCANGGTCTDHVNSFSCACVAGYSGLQCQTLIDECASQPCQNSGTCSDLVGAYSCQCVAGYSGTQCQTDINECASQPCTNGGTCTDHVNSYSCACVAGYSGSQCQTLIDECASQPCQNGGTCTDLTNAFSCACPYGFTGVVCQTFVSICSSIPCQNNGTCMQSPDNQHFTCNCTSNFDGPLCQFEINACVSQPCQNGGNCTFSPNNGYNCTCPICYSGTQCQTNPYWLVDFTYLGCTSNTYNWNCGQHGWGGFQTGNPATEVRSVIQTPSFPLVLSGTGVYHLDNQITSGGFGFQPDSQLAMPLFTWAGAINATTLNPSISPYGGDTFEYSFDFMFNSATGDGSFVSLSLWPTPDLMTNGDRDTYLALENSAFCMSCGTDDIARLYTIDDGNADNLQQVIIPRQVWNHFEW